ncbi:hypothetical protein FRC02_002702 [Tulasnella sp. 418]|nr:hypothetical protein FRC02_002702 [Tulasnella sp. 418]
MQQPGLVPSKFGGGSGEDAASWLDNLLIANAHASDLGVVRLFVSHLAPGSVAREWYDQLDDGDKSSWTTVERQFYKRWVASPTSACVSDPWMLFSSHTLTEEAIFDGFGPGSEEMINSQQVLVKWVTEHIRLGSNCREDDAVLLRTTLDLIPPFIRAHLRLSYHDDIDSLEGLCSEIAKIPMTVVEFERIRRQEADKDWRTMLEKNVREISEKVDDILEIIKKMDPSRADHPLAEVLEKDTTVDGSIAWEPSSPITVTTSRENLVPTRSATPTTAIRSTLIAAKGIPTLMKINPKLTWCSTLNIEESNEIVGEDTEISPIDNKPDALRIGSPFSSSIRMVRQALLL